MKFLPEDFINFNDKVIPGDKDSLDCIADIANAKLEQFKERVRKEIHLLSAMAGHPSAEDGCRNIIERCKEFEEELEMTHEEFNDLASRCSTCGRKFSLTCEGCETLKTKLKIAKEALEFYGSEFNYHDDDVICNNERCIVTDAGENARGALKAL